MRAEWRRVVFHVDIHRRQWCYKIVYRLRLPAELSLELRPRDILNVCMFNGRNFGRLCGRVDMVDEKRCVLRGFMNIEGRSWWRRRFHIIIDVQRVGWGVRGLSIDMGERNIRIFRTCDR